MGSTHFAWKLGWFEFKIRTAYEASTAYDASNSQNKAIEKGKRFEFQIWTAYEVSTAYDASNLQNKAIEKWNIKLSLY